MALPTDSNNVVIVKQLASLISSLWTKVKGLVTGVDNKKADKVTGATAGNFAGLDANGNLTDSGSKASDFKTKQSAVSDPTVGSTPGLEFIATASQNENGVITVTKQIIQNGTTSEKGVVQLSTILSSSDDGTAATPMGVLAAIDDAISSVYKPAGSSTISGLSGLNVKANLGKVYNMTDSGQTTEDFVEGAGKTINAGDNVVVVDVGSGTTHSYKFDLLSGMIDLSGYKTIQAAVTDPSASGNSYSFIDSASQDANGKITVTKKIVPDATTSVKGVVTLQDSIGASESTNTTAATPKAVRDAINDLDVSAVTVGASKTLASISEADGKISASAVDIQIAESQVTNLVDDLASKQDNLSFDGTYDASTNKVATESTVSGAIADLDVSAISVGADKTLSSISETDGKISATATPIQIAESQVTNLVDDLAGKAAVNHTHDTGITIITQEGVTPTTTLDVTEKYTLSTGGTSTTFAFTPMTDGEVTAILDSLTDSSESESEP